MTFITESAIQILALNEGSFPNGIYFPMPSPAITNLALCALKVTL